MPQLMWCMCVFGAMRGSVSEPPVWLWPAGCWEHGEGGWALETSPLTAWVCGGVSHPAEQVSRQTHCKSSPLWVRASLDSSPFITLYLFLSLFSHGFLSHWPSHSLMGVIFFTSPCNSPMSCFLLPLLSLPLTLSLYSFLSPSHDRAIHPGSVLTSVCETAGCSSKPLQHVAYVEHVVVRVTVTHSRRGDLSVALTSPSGTMSQLLSNR